MTAGYGYALRLFGEPTTATGAHWGSIRAHGTPSLANGATLKLGFWNSSEAVDWVEIGDLSTDYTRTSGTATLAATGYRLAIRLYMEEAAPPSTVSSVCTLTTVFACMGAGARVPDEVASQEAASSSKTKTEGELVTAHDPDNTGCTIALAQTPRLHSTSAPTSAETLLGCAANKLIGLDGSGLVEVTDGTNEANADLTEADGTSRTVTASWGGDVLTAAVVGGDSGTATYDGAVPAGNLTIHGTCRSVQSLIVSAGTAFPTGGLYMTLADWPTSATGAREYAFVATHSSAPKLSSADGMLWVL